MVADRKVIALVPARGGSKSIPRKNIRLLGGHPLLAYSIAAGLQARHVDRTIVSTDDEEIAAIARDYQAEVPFLRPAHLAEDQTPDLPFLEHVLGWLQENENYIPDAVVLLRPTSPLRPPDCVDQAIELLFANPQADSVRGVVPSGENPYKMWKISDSGALDALMQGEFDEPYNMPRQELPLTFWQTGHIDAIRSSTILQKQSATGDVIWPLLLDPEYTVDIDTTTDWAWAEWRLANGGIPVVQPAPSVRSLPEPVKMLVLDFDGVLTDNRVWVHADGSEVIAAHRGDGWGIARLRDAGIKVVVISTETDPVVAARCQKLKIPCKQGVGDKAAVLRALLQDENIDPGQVVFAGNDVNDLPCFPIVACAVAVADAHPSVLAQADLILKQDGGHGAVRALADRILYERETEV